MKTNSVLPTNLSFCFCLHHFLNLFSRASFHLLLLTLSPHSRLIRCSTSSGLHPAGRAPQDHSLSLAEAEEA